MKMKNSPFTALLIAVEVRLGNLSHRQSFAIILYNKHCRRFAMFYQVHIHDCYLQGDNVEDCANNILETVKLLDSLGFIIHLKNHPSYQVK